MEILALPLDQANVKRERHCQPQVAIPSPDHSPQIQLYSRSCYLTWQGRFPQLQRNMLKLAAVFPHLPSWASSLYTEGLQWVRHHLPRHWDRSMAIILHLFLFLAALGLCCCTQAFSSCDVYTSHCSGFSCCGVWAPGCAGLVAWWHVGSSQAKDTTRTLLCWQEDSKPLDHQESPTWPLFLTHPSSFMNHPWPNCAYFTTKIFLYSFHHLHFCSHSLKVSSQWTQQPFKCPP